MEPSFFPLSEPSVVALDVGRGAPFVRRAVAHAVLVLGLGVGAQGLWAQTTDAPATQPEPLRLQTSPKLDEALPATGDQALPVFVEADRLSSVILWGPPGTGKTTLARRIASRSSKAFVALSAVTASVNGSSVS